MLLPDLKVDPSENWPCFAGSGECSRPTTHAMDDGSGNYVYCCERHYIQFHATSKFFESLSEEQIARLEKAIADHE